MFDSAKVDPDVDGFVMSHLHFVIADRYSSHLNWFLTVTVSLVSELPLPASMVKKVNPNYAIALQRTYANLFEFTKQTFPALTYAQYQNILYRFMKKVESSAMKKASGTEE